MAPKPPRAALATAQLQPTSQASFQTLLPLIQCQPQKLWNEPDGEERFESKTVPRVLLQQQARITFLLEVVVAVITSNLVEAAEEWELCNNP